MISSLKHTLTSLLCIVGATTAIRMTFLYLNFAKQLVYLALHITVILQLSYRTLTQLEAHMVKKEYLKNAHTITGDTLKTKSNSGKNPSHTQNTEDQKEKTKSIDTKKIID